MTFVSSVPSTWSLAVHSVAIDYSLARTLRAAGTAQQHATSDGSHRGRPDFADTDCVDHQQTATPPPSCSISLSPEQCSTSPARCRGEGPLAASSTPTPTTLVSFGCSCTNTVKFELCLDLDTRGAVGNRTDETETYFVPKPALKFDTAGPARSAIDISPRRTQPPPPPPPLSSPALSEPVVSTGAR